MKSAAMRGREFEVEVADLLRNAGFEVIVNAGIARPRQTDIVASSDALDFLIETKNRSHKADVGDIDALRSRLNRTSSDIVGVIFTMAGLTAGAVKGIEADRSREILAITGAEIESVRSQHVNLRYLIDRKRNELRFHGKAWFATSTSSGFAQTCLPPGTIEFDFKNSVGAYFESRCGLSGASYALQIPDSGWSNTDCEGVRLSIRLALGSTNSLRNFMGYLHENFGLSSGGSFSIHQTETCWNGVGAENFLQTVDRWRERYTESAALRFHHSEEISYFDEFRNGWMELSSQQRVAHRDRASRLDLTELVIQLPGVPVDNSALLNLCRYTGNNWANFSYVARRQTGFRRLKKPVRLRAVGRAIEVGDPNDRRLVVGVIAENPFYERKSLPRELANAEMSLQELLKTQLILCSLRDWHNDGDLPDYYILQGFEATVAGRRQIIRPFGTWNEIGESISEAD